MPVLIKNGRVVTADTDQTVDLFCADDRITTLESGIDAANLPPDTQVIDASGKLVFPGFIDPHVHIHLPFMGTHAKDSWATASKAALLGGTTTLIEMICPAQTDDPMEAFEYWLDNAAGEASCDYTFHMGVSRFDHDTERALRTIVDRGVTSFKVFLAYKGAFAVTDEQLYRVLTLARELGVVVTAHCENAELVAQLQADLVASGKVGPEYHEPSRPKRVEAEGVHHLMTFAEMTGAQIYIVHTSCRDAVKAAVAARQRGVSVDIETVIPYLTLDSSYAEQPDFEGAKYVMSPPIREKAQQDYLWTALNDGVIATVATDHAPFDFEPQKRMGDPAAGSDFTEIPNGIPSVQHRVDLLYTHGVAAGRIDLPTFVNCASTRAARIFGLERKGDLKPGMDADIVIYDPDHPTTISASTHAMNTDYSAYEGWKTAGRADTVLVRGRIMVAGGEFVGEPGTGRLIPDRRR